MRRKRWYRAAAALLIATTASSASLADLPRIEWKGARPALVVDGAPFLMLGAQVNNSSNHVSVLPGVWETFARLHANTLEMPVSWSQVEPVEGTFDFSFLDSVLRDARTHDLRVVLLWFGTWKNGGPGYTPEWVRTDTRRFPRKRTVDGESLASLSPFSRSTLEADKRAYTTLMRHLADVDRQNTVIMVQLENEPGSFGISRDHTPTADHFYDQPIPEPLARALHKPIGNWRDVFGSLAERSFMSWHTARFIDEIAAAGKAIWPLPIYCNSALSDPLAPVADPRWVASGSPDWNMIDVWKAAAPHVDVVAPDIYTRDGTRIRAYFDAYQRPDNPLFVPEIGNAADYAPFFWSAIGRGAIGFAPFGVDATGYSNYPLGAKSFDAETLESFARDYRLMAPMARGWSRLVHRHPSWGASKDGDGNDQPHVFGRWTLTVQFDRWMIGDESWTFIAADPTPTKGRQIGGAAILQVDSDEFIVVGDSVRVNFALTSPAGEHWQYLSVDEGHVNDTGEWTTHRPWNGDQTDYGINLPSSPTMLKVRLGLWH